MRRGSSILFTAAAALMLLLATPASAHFGAVIPSDDIVTQDDPKTLNIEIQFLHPLEQHLMDMAKPKQFGVMHNEQKTDLLATLKEAKAKGHGPTEELTFWTAEYPIRRPGDYTFFIEPTPYWEPAEDLYIVHYTKVCVNALGLEEGWDQPVGLETEILPMARPYGLWTGNLFTGQVLLKGKPVPHAEVEIEYLNASPGNPSVVLPPAEPYVTQVVKADANGVFSYAMPKAGWWGFSALNEADWTIDHEGEKKNVEIGAVFWVHTRDMK
jgi:cobalt/nickel transport protein